MFLHYFSLQLHVFILYSYLPYQCSQLSVAHAGISFHKGKGYVISRSACKRNYLFFLLKRFEPLITRLAVTVIKLTYCYSASLQLIKEHSEWKGIGDVVKFVLDPVQ